MASQDTKRRISVVDDQPDITITLKIALEEDDIFDVYAFTDPERALSRFKPDLYDLVLIDIKMPKMNGFVLYERLKTVEPELMIRLDGSFGGVIWMRIMDSLGISSIYTKSERNSKTEAGQKYLDGYCSLVNIDSLSNWDCHNHFNHRFWYNHNLHAEKDK